MFRKLVQYIIFLLVIIPSILYFFLCVFLYFLQERLLFFPWAPYVPHYEKMYRNPDLKNVQIHTKDSETLDGWIQVGKDKPYVVLYFGGNGDETSYFVEKYRYKNANIISFNYRWYAYSTGKPSERALFSDALLQYDYLVWEMKIDPKNIILMGRSLGTGVATYLASQRKVNSVILITPYDSVELVAKEWYFFVPVSLLLRHKFLSTQYASIRSNNLLCIYWGRDVTIPNHHTENLLKYWNGKITKVFIPNATHDDIYTFSQVEDAIDQFIWSN